MKPKELRRKSIKELKKMEQEQREELRSLRFDLASGKVKNVKEVQAVKKNIAQIKTILNEKKNAE